VVLKSTLPKRITKLKNDNQGPRRASNFESQTNFIPTENQIFMACLDAHLYEIEYKVHSKVKKPPPVALGW
jgi:hypothetical protein